MTYDSDAYDCDDSNVIWLWHILLWLYHIYYLRQGYMLLVTVIWSQLSRFHMLITRRPIRGFVEGLWMPPCQICLFPSYENLLWSRVGPSRPNVIDVERLVSHYYCTLYLSWTFDEYLKKKKKNWFLDFPIMGFCPILWPKSWCLHCACFSSNVPLHCLWGEWNVKIVLICNYLSKELSSPKINNNCALRVIPPKGILQLPFDFHHVHNCAKQKKKDNVTSQVALLVPSSIFIFVCIVANTIDISWPLKWL